MDIYPVPERVSAGSPSPIPDMNRYREVYANRVRTLAIQQWDKLMQTVDVIVAPTNGARSAPPPNPRLLHDRCPPFHIQGRQRTRGIRGHSPPELPHVC